MNAAGRHIRVCWELLGWLCGTREAFSVEEALSQGMGDELKFVRVINVLVGVLVGIPDGWDNPGGSVNILLVVRHRNTMQTDSG